MTEIQFLNLHKYLHDQTIKFVTFENQKIPIYQNQQGLRYIVIKGVKYIQQNPKRDTSYGRMASNGHHVTWGIKDGKWDLAIDDKIKVFS